MFDSEPPFQRPGQVTDFLSRVLSQLVAVFLPVHAGTVGNYPNVCSHSGPNLLCTHIASQPFQGIKQDVYRDSNSTILELVDGGDAGETMLFASLLVKPRHVDVIVAIDASSDDEDNWPQ